MKTLLLVSGWMVSIAVVTAGPREYPCYRLAKAPDMDGRIAGEAWQDLPEAGGFYILSGTHFSPGSGTNFALVKQTNFRAGWTEDALFMAIRCEEPAMNQIKVQPKDGEAVWGDDSIEMLFYLPGVPEVIQLVANSRGARWNGIGMVPQNLWDWQAVGSAGSNEWSLEIKIPFTVLRSKPVNDARWRINIGRNLKTGPRIETLACWPLAKGSFHDVSGFGQFVFKTAPPPAAERAVIEQQLLAPYHAYLRATFNKIAAENRAYEGPVAEVFSNAVRQAKNAALQKEAAALKATTDRFAQLCAGKNPPPEEMAAVIVSYQEAHETPLPERVEELKDKLLMESLFP